MNWPTNAPTQQGLDAIRQSYERMRESYLEPRKPPKMSWTDLIAFRRKRGPVEFSMEGYNEPTAIDLDAFMNPNSFKDDNTRKNPLSWIRVNTEYFDYWFAGEVYGRERDAGIIGLENVPDEIVGFYKGTSAITLPDNQLIEVRQTLDQLLTHLPRLVKR